jgi:phage shock protein A
MSEDDLLIDALIGQVKRYEIEISGLREQLKEEQDENIIKKINRSIKDLDNKISGLNTQISSLKTQSYKDKINFFED